MRSVVTLLAFLPVVALAEEPKPALPAADPFAAEETIAQQADTIGKLYQAVGQLSHQVVQLKRDLAAKAVDPPAPKDEKP